MVIIIRRREKRQNVENKCPDQPYPTNTHLCGHHSSISQSTRFPSHFIIPNTTQHCLYNSNAPLPFFPPQTQVVSYLSQSSSDHSRFRKMAATVSTIGAVNKSLVLCFCPPLGSTYIHVYSTFLCICCFLLSLLSAVIIIVDANFLWLRSNSGLFSCLLFLSLRLFINFAQQQMSNSLP